MSLLGHLQIGEPSSPEAEPAELPNAVWQLDVLECAADAESPVSDLLQLGPLFGPLRERDGPQLFAVDERALPDGAQGERKHDALQRAEGEGFPLNEVSTVRKTGAEVRASQCLAARERALADPAERGRGDELLEPRAHERVLPDAPRPVSREVHPPQSPAVEERVILDSLDGRKDDLFQSAPEETAGPDALHSAEAHVPEALAFEERALSKLQVLRRSEVHKLQFLTPAEGAGADASEARRNDQLPDPSFHEAAIFQRLQALVEPDRSQLALGRERVQADSPRRPRKGVRPRGEPDRDLRHVPAQSPGPDDERAATSEQPDSVAQHLPLFPADLQLVPDLRAVHARVRIVLPAQVALLDAL